MGLSRARQFLDAQFHNPIKEAEIDLKDLVKVFVMDHPHPEESELHDFCNKLNISPSEFETALYSVLTDYMHAVGKHRDVPDENYDPDQLKMGMEIELEHTDDYALSKEIAKDHLAEIPDYYTRLKDMEDTAMAAQNKAV